MIEATKALDARSLTSMTDGGRPNPRLGELKKEEAKEGRRAEIS